MSIVLENVSKRYDQQIVVNNVSLEIKNGEFFVLLGSSGSGKTTILNIIAGLVSAEQGRVLLHGRDVTHLPTQRRNVGYVFQNYALFEYMTVAENIVLGSEPGSAASLDLKKAAEEIRRVSDEFKLSVDPNVTIESLSVGQQQRVELLKALYRHAQLLILDEPTTGLDPAVRLTLWSRIRELRTSGTTVLLTTHYMDEAQRLCDSVAIISEGKIIDQGGPAGLIERHLAAETVEFDCAVEEEPALLNGMKAARQLRVGKRLMVYLDDATELSRHIRLNDRTDRRGLIVRPTNLEDVYLALTGTRLEASR